MNADFNRLVELEKSQEKYVVDYYHRYILFIFFLLILWTGNHVYIDIYVIAVRRLKV